MKATVVLVLPLLVTGGAGAAATRVSGAPGQSAPATRVLPSQVHEALVGEAPEGAAITALRVLEANGDIHLAWVEQSKPGKNVRVDGQPVGGPYTDVTCIGFLGDAAKLTYVAATNSTWILRSGASEYNGYSKITPPDAGPHGEVAAGVCRAKQCRLLLDGRETGPVFDDIGAPDFSPQRDHSVYFGKRNRKWVALVDGAPSGAEMDDWWTHRWWPTGSRLAVAARFGDKWTWVVDGQPGPLFDVIGRIAISPDGGHYAYGGANSDAGMARQKVVGSIVVDGQALDATYAGRGMLGNWTWLGGTGRFIAKGLRVLSADFHGVSDPAFTSRGELVVAQRAGEGQVAVRVGDHLGPTVDDVVSAIVLTPDGEHIAYVAKRGDAFVEMRDEQAGPTFPATRKIGIVPWIAMSRSGHLRYELLRGGVEFKEGRSQRALRRIVLDGVQGPEYDALGTSVSRISDAGDQHAYVVFGADGSRDRLVVNGHESALYDEIVAGSIAFVPPSGIRFIARQGRRVLRVTIDLH